MKYHQITAYHPQSNGLVERLNGTLKKTLMKIMDTVDEWDHFVAPALFAYRSAPIESIGVTSGFMEYGRDLRMPLDIQRSTSIWDRLIRLIRDVPIFRKEAQQRLISKQKLQPNTTKRLREFQVGDQVLIRKTTHGWHETKWDGPFEITKKFSHGTYQLQDENGRTSKPINGNLLKIYKDRKYLELVIIIEAEF